ncbi:hypothetical protein RHMOL_Rhmol13G0180300 [Rhododendron molle]|uniref:Uncharacterized protein n=1 Tax=Rhododendron molle TaxID=49168 RepID=A0ACC0L929_RHOML|nr:hypothetical protein RHMOL_Rhmol13G0180300 [Rhododendron molle]
MLSLDCWKSGLQYDESDGIISSKSGNKGNKRNHSSHVEERFPKDSICPHQKVCTGLQQIRLQDKSNPNSRFFLLAFAQTKTDRISTKQM